MRKLGVLWFFKSHATTVRTKQIQLPELTSTFLSIELNDCEESTPHPHFYLVRTRNNQPTLPV